MVDDDAAVGRALRRMIAIEHEVVIVHCAQEALDRIAQGERFDLVLSDVMMPEMTGTELHAALAEVAPALARRDDFLTGGAFDPATQEVLDRLPNVLLEKPCPRQTLLAAIRGGSASLPEPARGRKFHRPKGIGSFRRGPSVRSIHARAAKSGLFSRSDACNGGIDRSRVTVPRCSLSSRPSSLSTPSAGSAARPARAISPRIFAALTRVDDIVGVHGERCDRSPYTWKAPNFEPLPALVERDTNRAFDAFDLSYYWPIVGAPSPRRRRSPPRRAVRGIGGLPARGQAEFRRWKVFEQSRSRLCLRGGARRRRAGLGLDPGERDRPTPEPRGDAVC